MLRSYITVAVLCLINLINYMDRFTIAGVLNEITKYFNIGTTQGGLLQTAFICSYMIFAPLFGFLGDRYSRKWIIIFGVTFWSIVTFLSSFVQQNHTALFFFFRALVGIGEASYSTVAPTIIADLFTGKMRSTMIAMFYFAIPVGSGLGYIVGTFMSKKFGSWEWALRFTPIFGILSAFTFLFISEPKRGAVEVGEYHEQESSTLPTKFNFWETIKGLRKDMSYLFSVTTYVHITFGFTAVCFSTGALSWWAPYFMHYAIPTEDTDYIGFLFGVIACLGGILGVIIGSASSQYLRPKYPSVDSYICFIGVLLSIPFVFSTIFFARDYPKVAWICIFFAITFLSTNWSVVVDVLLYVIVPNRRATAQSIQILVSHTLGDAASPFIVGSLSEIFSGGSSDNDVKYYSLSYALYVTPAVLIFGAIFFFWSSHYLRRDEIKCKEFLTHEARLTGTGTNESNSPMLRPTESFGHDSTNNLVVNNRHSGGYSKAD